MTTTNNQDKKICIDCGMDLSYRTSPNSKRCTKCNRRYYVRKGSKVYAKIQLHNKARRIYSETIYKIYDSRCAICKWRIKEKLDARIDYGYTTNYISYGNAIHHIISIKDGGTDEIGNLILLCPNHHKTADWGIIKTDELRKYQIPEHEISNILIRIESEKEINMVKIRSQASRAFDNLIDTIDTQ